MVLTTQITRPKTPPPPPPPPPPRNEIKLFTSEIKQRIDRQTLSRIRLPSVAVFTVTLPHVQVASQCWKSLLVK